MRCLNACSQVNTSSKTRRLYTYPAVLRALVGDETHDNESDDGDELDKENITPPQDDDGNESDKENIAPPRDDDEDDDKENVPPLWPNPRVGRTDRRPLETM